MSKRITVFGAACTRLGAAYCLQEPGHENWEILERNDYVVGVMVRIKDRRFKFAYKSQTDFELSDIDKRLVDLAFFDASHDFLLNVTTFEKVKGLLSERALIVIHETGAWHGNLKGFQTTEGYLISSLPS